MQNDKNLKERFAGFGAKPSENLWNKIENSLDKKEKKRNFILWWISGSAAVIVFFVIFKTSTSTNIKASNEKETTNVPKKPKIENISYQNESINEKSKTVLENSTQKQAKKISTQKQTVLTQVEKQLSDEKVLKNDLEHTMTSTEKELKDSIIETNVKNDLTENVTIDSIQSGKATSEVLIQTISESLDILKPKKKIEFGILYGAFRGSKTSTLNSASFSNNESLTNNDASQAISSNSIIYYPIIPINIQLYIAKEFENGIKISSGIGFANFGNVIKNGKNTYKSQHNRFNIPLLVEFVFLKRRSIQLYSGIGLNNDISIPSNKNSDAPKYFAYFQAQSSINFLLNENCKLAIQPVLRYDFINQNDLPFIGDRLLFGGNLGIIRMF
jgi:hypothetical protein